MSATRLRCASQIGMALVCSCFQLVPAQDYSQKNSDPPHFVGEFSSAHDVKHQHPTLDKVLDVAVGPRPEDPSITVLQQPAAVTKGPGNRVFVVDRLSRKVHVFDFGGAKHFLLQYPEAGQPISVALDKDGSAFVTDSHFATVLVFDPKGKFRRFLKESRGRESFFDSPAGIAIDQARGRIYVVDAPRHMVIVLDKKGRVLSQLGTRGGGSAPGQFRDPTQIAITRDEVLVLDVGNARVQVLDTRGNFRRQLNVLANKRSGLAVDENRRLYVSNDDIEMIQVYAPDGEPLYTFGHAGTHPGEFKEPCGLWMDAGHCLYVTDSKNSRVQLFQVSGNGLCELH